MERIIQEKISADHLLYVSLKYTKTADVILNLLDRWRSLIENSVDIILEKAKRKRLLKVVPSAPKLKFDKVRELFKKNPAVAEALELHAFFRTVPELEKLRENEFRKNVTLKVLSKGNWIDINVDKLKEYASMVERFISEVKQFLSK